jgi:hypothetical protein
MFLGQGRNCADDLFPAIEPMLEIQKGNALRSFVDCGGFYEAKNMLDVAEPIFRIRQAVRR